MARTADEDRRLGGGLGTAIFMLPQVFGWLVFRPGYDWIVRIVVAIYMILSSIPLYFLIVTLWGSGGDIRQMARDFSKNREAAARNSDRAFGYMHEYNAGGRTIPADGPAITGINGNSPAPANPPAAAAPAAPIDAARLSAEQESGAIKARSGPVTVSGKATAATIGQKVYLAGSGAYPAVTLEYAGAAPSVQAGESVTATCQTVTGGGAGPTLGGCR